MWRKVGRVCTGVILRPFRGFHPPSDLMQRMACPPFDVIESDEAREMAKGNEKSFLHVDKPEIDFPQGTSQYDDAVYKKGKENLDLFIKNVFLFLFLFLLKWLTQDEKPCLYIYSQEMKVSRTGKVHVQYGIAAEVSAKQYEEKIIKIHEFTRPKKEDDRTRLTDTQSECLFF
ncbi:hypothetical protein RFI_33231 [Reticulomyxa filosa]|uniref:Uncharacterized protein n=1 Tax=Reticulomyxa filosa TaxID=46433 RepID=X6LSR6_RETFI|nr:hypothetical protein RFI_33231 [Reticulomyxa filosa]|eukprot:ETO04167.1 hypothetical protein RFI_33231 [Reticulomyxa filosa]